MWNQEPLLNNWAQIRISFIQIELDETGPWSHTYNHGYTALPLLPVHSQTCCYWFHIFIYLFTYILLCYVFLYLHMFTMYSPHHSSFLENCWNMLVGDVLLAWLFYLGLQWVVTMVLLKASMENYYMTSPVHSAIISANSPARTRSKPFRSMLPAWVWNIVFIHRFR